MTRSCWLAVAGRGWARALAGHVCLVPGMHRRVRQQEGRHPGIPCDSLVKKIVGKSTGVLVCRMWHRLQPRLALRRLLSGCRRLHPQGCTLRLHPCREARPPCVPAASLCARRPARIQAVGGLGQPGARPAAERRHREATALFDHVCTAAQTLVAEAWGSLRHGSMGAPCTGLPCSPMSKVATLMD